MAEENKTLEERVVMLENQVQMLKLTVFLMLKKTGTLDDLLKEGMSIVVNGQKVQAQPEKKKQTREAEFNSILENYDSSKDIKN